MFQDCPHSVLSKTVRPESKMIDQLEIISNIVSSTANGAVIFQPSTEILHQGRGHLPKTKHKLVFEIPLPQATVSTHLHTDKNALRERIVALRAEGMSYRKIAQEIGLHCTWIGQILRSRQGK